MNHFVQCFFRGAAFFVVQCFRYYATLLADTCFLICVIQKSRAFVYEKALYSPLFVRRRDGKRCVL